MTETKKKFLLTGARAASTLDLARQLHAAGHQVFGADTINWHVCSFSNTVAANYTVPSPREKTEEFVDALIDIVIKEGIDCLIPTYEEIIYISKSLDRFPKSCRVLSSSFETLRTLHNKYLFYQRQQKFGIAAPRTELITNMEELEKKLPKTGVYAFKACYSRASQKMCKIENGKPLPDIKIEPGNPWVLQEWLDGKKFCTYSVCHDGVVKAHAVYPVEFAIDGNSCLNFKAVDHPGILKWLQKFAALEKFTGQIAFDFFETADGKVYAIECNPRATHGLLLFSPEKRLDQALLNQNSRMIAPDEGFERQIAFGMLMYGWKSAFRKGEMKQFWKTLVGTQDVILNPNDLMPFITQPFLFPLYLYKSFTKGLPIPAWFTFDYNWDGEHFENVKSSAKTLIAT